MSLIECPAREPGERSQAGREPIVEWITYPELGYLVGNFGIGQTTLPAGAKAHPNWSHLIRAVMEPGSRWQLQGLSDCHGPAQLNATIRQQRANTLLAALPRAAAGHVILAEGALSNDCITSNENRFDRAWNRAVLVTAVERNVDMSPIEITGKRRLPKPVDQPTADCTDDQKKKAAQAQPIAVKMVESALSALRDQKNPAVKRLLLRYFNDDSATTFEEVRKGFLNTIKGLRADIKLECEKKGTWLYGRFCKGSRVAYVRMYIGIRVHLCEAFFDMTDLHQARTFVHEFSHMFDYASGDEYCKGPDGCPRSLDPKDAYNNADSYACFAHDALGL